MINYHEILPDGTVDPHGRLLRLVYARDQLHAGMTVAMVKDGPDGRETHFQKTDLKALDAEINKLEILCARVGRNAYVARPNHRWRGRYGGWY